MVDFASQLATGCLAVGTGIAVCSMSVLLPASIYVAFQLIAIAGIRMAFLQGCGNGQCTVEIPCLDLEMSERHLGSRIIRLQFNRPLQAVACRLLQILL